MNRIWVFETSPGWEYCGGGAAAVAPTFEEVARMLQEYLSTDGKQHTATEKDVKSKWGGDGFRCSLCWHPFAVGDKYRWVYMNGASPSPGNFFVCDLCDEPDIAEKVRAALRSGSDMLNMDRWALVYRYQELYKQLEALASKELKT